MYGMGFIFLSYSNLLIHQLPLLDEELPALKSIVELAELFKLLPSIITDQDDDNNSTDDKDDENDDNLSSFH